MKKFLVKPNKYLDRDVVGYFRCYYVGYQKSGNPDFINNLKNMSGQKSEKDLVEDFVEVCEILTDDLNGIAKTINDEFVILVMPRAKIDSEYKQSQLMFRKAVSSVAKTIKMDCKETAIKRIKDSKITHNWRLENNTGKDPYVGITSDTCKIDINSIANKNVLLVDDVYTKNVNVIEDCISFLFENGAKSVILYVIAKTKE